MKSTKIMLALIATTLITWCVIGFIGFVFSDLSYRDCMTCSPTVFIMFIIGWIPGLIVANDLDDIL